VFPQVPNVCIKAVVEGMEIENTETSSDQDAEEKDKTQEKDETIYYSCPMFTTKVLIALLI